MFSLSLRRKRQRPKLTIKFNRPQSLTRLAQKPKTVICTPWGRGVGKSWQLLTNLLGLVAEQDGKLREGALDGRRGIRCVLMLPTFKQAKDLQASKLDELLAPGGEQGFLRAKIDHTSWKITFPGGSWLQLFGAENAHASRGLRTDVVAIDEADDIDLPVYDSVISPWFSEPWSIKIRLVSGTPRRGRYGLLYRTHMRGTPQAKGEIRPPELRYRKNHFSLHATGYDTPETVSRDQLEEQRADTVPEIFRREQLCDFDSSEGLVYGEVFRESFHVAEPPAGTIFRDIVVGVDWGYEDPTAIVVVGLVGSGKDTACQVLEELYERHLTQGQIVAKAKAIFDRQVKLGHVKQHWQGDPSRPDAIEAFRQAGIFMRGARNTIEDGISFVADRLFVRKTPENVEFAKLYISKKCRAVIGEFARYRRKRDVRADRVLEAPEDKNNHAMDALRYAIFTHLGIVERTKK